ncbi:MAG: hypothetical protein ACI85Q_001995 [Salibacteraceae bacterium]|jgi:hypothetical protein
MGDETQFWDTYRALETTRELNALMNKVRKNLQTVINYQSLI